jgi:two-component system C4-dicarboxylate transport sensor histidine kinase DctB
VLHWLANDASIGAAVPPALSRRARVLWVLALCVSAFVTAWISGAWFAGRALDSVQRRAEVAAALHAASLQSDLEKFRTLPFVLAQDPDVRGLLAIASTAPAPLNQKLEALAEEVRADAVYLVDGAGVTVAASNWRTPTSFVGQDYTFRPYFREALENGYAELYALGTVSGEPGLYLARRVEPTRGRSGVVVVKVVFDGIEDDWARAEDRVFVTDERGVVVITSVPEWRFRTLEPLAPETIPQLRESRQYGANATLEQLPLRFEDGRVNDGAFVSVETSTASTGWRLHLLAPTNPTVNAAETTGRVIGALAIALIWGAAFVLVSARRRALRERQRQDFARRELEARVADRTSELKTANTQLLHEIDERRRAESNLQLMQDELVQANKLAVLGQISAGVAHEINQPVSAIRSYVDNASAFLRRGQADDAEKNLSAIAALTERIGAITQELRAFSRKRSSAPTPVRVAEVIEGALLLTSARARAMGVTIDIRHGDAAIVIADRIRLEQVVVNLLQNALDALAPVSAPTIGSWWPPAGATEQ